MKTSERVMVWFCVIGAVLGLGGVYLWPLTSAGPAELPPARSGDVPPLAVRDTPVSISPTTDFTDVVDDESLYRALDSAVPYADPPVIAHLLHELRLWGVHSRFPVVDTRKGRDGAWTMDVLLDNAKAEQEVMFAEKFEGFLIDTRYGIRVLTVADPGTGSPYSQGHYGQMLQALAEVGATANTPVNPDTGEQGTIQDLVSDSAARFSLDDEPEFVASAFARWLPPGTDWQHRFGRVHTMDELALHLTKLPPGEGTCFGGHLPYAMTVILRVNEQEQIISDEARTAVENRLKNISQLLTDHQHADGSWDFDWSGGDSEMPNFVPSSPDMGLVTCTGHHLEWIALAPPELRPDDAVIVSAIRALENLMRNRLNKREQSFKDLLPASHAARALAMLRGVDPYEFWKERFEANTGIKVDAN